MAGIIDLFVPREQNFFKYINKQITLLDEASDTLALIVQNKKPDPKKLQKQIEKIRKNSNEVDDISHEIISQLHKVFITSVDREDIKSLAINISIIIDSIKGLGSSISYLKVKKFDSSFIRQVEILHESVELLQYIFKEPLSTKRNGKTLDKMKQLEKDADDIYRKAVGSLFVQNIKPIEVIRQKELYDAAEDTIDNVRRIVDLLETIILINS